MVCYVCGYEISDKPVYIGKSKKCPDGLYRHSHCEPGSECWLKSEGAKASELYEDFTIQGEVYEPL